MRKEALTPRDRRTLDEAWRSSHRGRSWKQSELAPAKYFSRSDIHPGAQETGLRLLRDGKVGCLLVAGGQSSRLGVSQPKGTVEIAPGRSLFHVFAEKLLARSRTAKGTIPLYVMTSPATDRPTREFFRKHADFGLPHRSVRFFVQGTVPTVDLDGVPLFDSSGKILRNPDGHGGMLAAAQRARVFADARKRGLTTLFYFQVDNPGVSVCDPIFLGLHVLNRSVYSLKIVRKREPEEKLGVLCRLRNRLQMVEYSELPPFLREKRRTDGSLLYDAGSIAIHIFDLTWISQLARSKTSLPWHKALKKVLAIDDSAKLVERPAIKFEKFVFDLLPKAARTVVLETDRSREFCPLKERSDLYKIRAYVR